MKRKERGEARGREPKVPGSCDATVKVTAYASALQTREEGGERKEVEKDVP